MTNKINKPNISKAEGIAWMCFALLILTFSLYISHLV